MEHIGNFVIKKIFTNEVSKEAYLSACKWLAVNIYSNSKLSEHIAVSIEKDCIDGVPAFIVSIYAKSDSNEIKKVHCKECKKLHTTFYCVEKLDCTQCKLNAYFKKVEKETQNKTAFIRSLLSELEESNE